MKSCSCSLPYEQCCGAKEQPRPGFYSSTLPPHPTLEEIRKVIRDELRRVGLDG